MDIYAEITNRIISEMETGIIPWQKPFLKGFREYIMPKDRLKTIIQSVFVLNISNVRSCI